MVGPRQSRGCPTAKTRRCPGSELEMLSEAPVLTHATDGEETKAQRAREACPRPVQNSRGPRNSIHSDEAWNLILPPKTASIYCIKPGVSSSTGKAGHTEPGAARVWQWVVWGAGSWSPSSALAKCSYVQMSVKVALCGRTSDTFKRRQKS